MTKGFQATETIGVGLINCYQCTRCQTVVDCLTPPESSLCPTCRGEPPHFEKVRYQPPLWQRAHSAGLQPNMVALLRCLYEEDEPAVMERYGWDYETLQNYKQRLVSRLRPISDALADEAETFLSPRPCSFCGHSPAPYRVTKLTPEQRQANQAWADSLKEAFHTGHCPHLELPTFACQPCYDAHPESHLR